MTISLRNDVEYQNSLDVRTLAREMLRLDDRIQWARDAHEWDAMFELMVEREEIVARRSGLLRASWLWRKRYWRAIG